MATLCRAASHTHNDDITELMCLDLFISTTETALKSSKTKYMEYQAPNAATIHGKILFADHLCINPYCGNSTLIEITLQDHIATR